MAMAITKLTAAHAVVGFCCGKPALDTYLHKHALTNSRTGGAQTYVGVTETGEVVGYYSLAVGAVTHADAPERLAKGLARHPIPVMILARLATATDWHGKGVGAGLLRDAMLRTLQAADIAGIRAIVVHAKDDTARAFYERFDFTPWPDNPVQLFLLLKDARTA